MAVKFADFDKTIEEIDEIAEKGLPKGLSCGWPVFDKYFTIVPGMLNVLSGYPSSGKSEFMENIACHLAVKHKWNIYEYVPETYPTKRHYISLIEKIVGKPVFARGGFTPMTDKERYKAEHTIKKHFLTVSADDDPYTFEEILKDIDKRCLEGERIDMVILDPWNEMESGKPPNMNETEYIGRSLMMARRVARRHRISFWIIPHPAKPQKDRDGRYPEPSLYDLAGSAHWRNKTDNGIIVHRPSIKDTRVEVTVLKVKNRFYGKPGTHAFFFETSNGRYTPSMEM